MRRIMMVLNWAVFGEASPVNSRAHLPAEGKDKHFLLADKWKLQSKFESCENILLFPLLTRLDESNLHGGCLIGRGVHLWAALAEGTRDWLVHFVGRLPCFWRGGGTCFTWSASVPHIPKAQQEPNQVAILSIFPTTGSIPYFRPQTLLFSNYPAGECTLFTYCSGKHARFASCC